MLRARSPLGVFRGRPPFDRQPARLSDRGPPQPASELCGSRRCLQGLGLSVVGGANRGETLGKAAQGCRRDEGRQWNTPVEERALGTPDSNRT